MGNVFVSVPDNRRDIALVNAMMKAYGNNECMQSAHDLLIGHASLCNKQSFVILLNGYSHSCSDDAMDRAVDIWENMIPHALIKYDLLIMTSLIDGLARRGFVYSAFEYVTAYNKFHKLTQKNYDDVMYTCLLSGCRERNNRHLAEYVGKQIESVLDLKSNENRKA